MPPSGAAFISCEKRVDVNGFAWANADAGEAGAQNWKFPQRVVLPGVGHYSDEMSVVRMLYHCTETKGAGRRDNP
jgi:hypothetical protein